LASRDLRQRQGQPQAKDALLEVYTGKLGGAGRSDLVKLIGEVVSVEQVPITFDVQGGKGTIKVARCRACMPSSKPYKSAEWGDIRP